MHLVSLLTALSTLSAVQCGVYQLSALSNPAHIERLNGSSTPATIAASIAGTVAKYSKRLPMSTMMRPDSFIGPAAATPAKKKKKGKRQGVTIQYATLFHLVAQPALVVL